MRQALNENPKVQAGVIGVLILVGIFMFMRMSGGGDSGAGDPAAATDAATAGAGAGAVPVDPATGAPVDPTTAGVAATGATATGATVPSAPASAAGTIPPEALVPGPGLPADVAQAYARGDVIVLLLVKEGATDDELVKDSVARISGPRVSVFVAPAGKVARFSRITQGVGVTRVPALVVVRPRSISGSSPQATVSYGFRELGSVIQAVQDAAYRGRDDVPYHPG